MNAFFYPTVEAVDVPTVLGWRYLPGYLGQAEETSLGAAIGAIPWNIEWKRRRQPYGAGYGTGGESPPIPEWGRQHADRMFADMVTARPFDQMLVNEYTPGQGISSHRDYAPYGRTVVSLNLLSPCVMDFKHVATVQKESLLLEPRSLLILSEAARHTGNMGSPLG